MFRNTKPLSAPIADDGNDIKHTKTRLLHSRGNPIFSWIRNSCNNDDSTAPNSKPNIILSTDPTNNKKFSNNNKENNSSQPELRGVQNLRHLWNSRITKAAKALSPAKSYGCLLQEEKPPPDITRALSVHNIIESLEYPTSVRSAKDNFYKYKTAATIEKNRCQSASPADTPSHGLSSRLSFNNCQMIKSTKSGENIHWMRRDDIMVPKKKESSLFQRETDDDTKIITMKPPHLVEATPATPQEPLLQAVIDCDNKSSEHNHSIGKTRDAIGSQCSLNSLRSLETTTSSTTVTSAVPRRKNVNSTRRYSFKTQVKSYHSPRKMPNYNGSNASNKVAKLTQQFNEIIQKDKKILNEVKRNNGILISRGGHVYKIIDNSDAMATEPLSLSTVLPSRDKETQSSPIKNISTVQRAIETFESRTCEKPKLPLKSAQVLRKKKELVSRKEIKNEQKSTVLEEIREEAKISEEQKIQPCSKRVKNDFSLVKVSNVVELLEGNKLKIKTEQKSKTSDIFPPSDVSGKLSKLTKKTKDSKSSDKFSFRGIFCKSYTNKEDEVDSKMQPKFFKSFDEKYSRISEDAIDKKTLQLSNEMEEEHVSESTSNNIPEVEEDPSELLAEEKILDALKEVNDKIESLCSTEISESESSPGNSFFNQAEVEFNDEETILNEAINTSLVDKIEAIHDDEDETEKTETINTSLLDQIQTINDDEHDIRKTEEGVIEHSDIKIQNSNNDEGIYEFIATETKTIIGFNSSTPIIQPQKSFLFCNKRNIVQNHEEKQTLESCENYESINGSCEAKPSNDYGYEICETPKETLPAPPRPRKGSTESQRNTTDKLPDLPNPKRIIPKKIFTAVISADYISSRTSESGSINDDDSIYDTIKGSPHCYESLKSSREKEYKCADTVSLASNGYESINNYRRRSMLGNTDSSSTISSEHKTNSLYEVSMVNGMLVGSGGVGGHNYSHSYITSSENSDDWVDISDSEVNAYDLGKQQFIVVRERTKCHRSPDWSKRVRDKRLHQTISDDDDVDHYYEPLFPVGNPNVSKTNGNMSSPVIPKSEHSDDYDSFETDDDIYEDNESTKKDDSGVDIGNVKLPDPPPTKRQIYNFMKKFKNLIIKKSPNDPNKNDSVHAKIYENTQNHMEGNEYQPTLKPSRRAPDKPNINKDRNSKDENIYENTDFQNSNLITSHSTTENGLKQCISERSLNAPNEMVNRSKSNTGMSFKSRLKSLGATSYDSKHISTMSIARSTFYVSETSSEQDSGIFEKVSPADFNSEKPQVEQTVQQPVVVIRKNKKQTSTLNAYRRQTSIGLRPNDPPPPPPISENRTSKQRPSTTSWYAECGVFKIQNTVSVDDVNFEKQATNLNKSTSNTSWYAEAGLYQTSGVSVASSSGSSGVSMGNEGATGEDSRHHVFLNEPLYQIYSAEKLESISRDMEDHESVNGYEEIGLHGRNSKSERPKRTRPTALQLVGPKSGPSRTLWSEIPEVISSEILLTLTPRERSLQEAKFEIITSEASYLKSLKLLRSHFMNHHTFHDTTILSSRDRRALFSYITPVHECSEKLLSELEACWQENIMLLGLSKSIYTCAEKHFQVYVAYCEHQGRMDRSLRRLKEAKGVFCQKLEQLESDPACCGLTLHSFLMLPMQRITRLPLLIDAVFSKVQPDNEEYDYWKLTLAILNKIVAQCNEAANRCEQAYEIERISKQLEFPSHIRALAIAPAGVAATGAKPRFLVKKGELVHLIWRGDDAKLTFGKKFTKSNIYAFLFSDLMVLSKRKGEEQFTVFDYCPRNMLTISSGDSIPQLPTKDANQTGKNLILMTLLENNERKTVELMLSCPSVSEMERWLQAIRPPETETPGEKLYEQWDCPQVTATHEFAATEPDLVSLEVGDVVNVSRKLPDGWFYGERIRDGVTGWFPGSFTEEVNSAHVRARNLKQRYRLLTFTATYLEMQKRK